jgi:hypothetical protein
MKLIETEKLKLEVIYLKLQLLQNQVAVLNQEHNKLQLEKAEIIKGFAEANGLDADKLSVDIPTGEVNLIEDKIEV